MTTSAPKFRQSLALNQLPRASFHALAKNVKALTPSPFVLQIGAMDGVLFDLLHPHLIKGGWRGILVEPLPDMFEALQNTYAAQPQLTLVNCAIGDHEGAMALRRIDPKAVAEGLLPKEALGIATGFADRGLFARSDYAARFAAHTVIVQAPCRTLQKLLDEHNVDKIDVVVIDAEGADWLIAKQLDFAYYKPRLFCMEHSHLTAGEIEECYRFLSTRGYSLAVCEEDAENIIFHRNLNNAGI
jgi:FkbM family methyltransferase